MEKCKSWNEKGPCFWCRNILTLAHTGILHSSVLQISSVPEIIDPVFAKTSQNARFLLIENNRFGLVFVKTGSINSVTGLWSRTFSVLLQENSVRASNYKCLKKLPEIHTAWGGEVQELDTFSKFSNKVKWLFSLFFIDYRLFFDRLVRHHS